MLEIEIKAYCRDHEKVKNLIRNLGGKHIKSEINIDIYFNHPCRDFAKTDEAIRIRNTGEKSFITYKGPKLGNVSKTRFEEEMEIKSPDSMKEILLRLGFVEVFQVEKKRDIYELNDIHICLDSVKNLGDFIELEKIGTDQDGTEKELFILADKLGIDKFERRSYLELLLKDS